jgi:putative membrane protein
MTLPHWLPPYQPHPEVWLLFGSIGAAYLIACRRHLVATGEVTTRRKKKFFIAGLAVLWLGADWPIHDLAEHYLYSVHMVQHMLFSFVAAPFLIAGMPVWLLRRYLRPKPVRVVFRFFTRPLVALIFFNGVLLFIHWPAVVTLSVTASSAWPHFLLHLLLLLASLCMWWPILSPLPEMPPLPAPGQMLYLFLQSLAPSIPASFLTFGRHPLYPIYETFPRIWGMSAMTDQVVAGLIMKIVGAGIIWAVIAVVFFRWYGAEQRGELDALQYLDIQREIRAKVDH